MRDDYLFVGNDLRTALKNTVQSAMQSIEGIDAEQFACSSNEEIADNIYSQYETESLEIFPEEMEMEQEETQVDVSHDTERRFFSDNRGPIMVPGLRITVSFPFRGDAGLWQCQPSTYTSCPPRAKIRSNLGRGDKVILIYDKPSDSIGDGTKLRQEIDRAVEDIQKYMEWQASDVANHNGQLRQWIEQRVENRRERIGKHENVLKALNIPLKKKAGSADIVVMPMNKKVIRPLPQKPNGPPEHAIGNKDFEFILKVIRHEGRSFETTPATFAKHDEEELRDFILAHLNTHYEGQATGETFRKKGKTDIRIEHENRAAFVAECKVWRGPKSATDAVDQLLGYLTWRDCKASLVFFNTENAGFSKIQEKLPEVLQTHSRFHGRLSSDEPGEWRFRFMSEDDDNRYVILHVFLFNLFVK